LVPLLIVKSGEDTDHLKVVISQSQIV